MRLVAPVAAVLAFAGTSLTAADLTIADLRVGAGVLSDQFKGASRTTVTDGQGGITTTRSSEDGRDADSHYRAQVQFVGGRLGTGGGFIYGLGLGVNHATWDNGSQDAHATSPSIGLLLGYGYAFTPAWHIEVTPFAGYGRTYYSVSDGGSSETSEEWSEYVEYGARIGTYVALGDDLVLGIEIPYLVGRFEPDYDYDDGTDSVSVSDERRSEGFGVLLTLGGRF
jgi:hypothetical protein